MKKRLTIILTAVIISISMAAVKLPAFANSDIEINSIGSMTLEGGDVSFDAKDIEDMKTQVKNLYDDLPEGAYASSKEGTLKNDIISKGIINYDSGKVIFDASDFIRLANGIDNLKTCYQSEVVKYLNRIHTYFKSDGTVTHVESEAISSDDASNLTFGQICNGILKSQSLEHLAGENILPASADNLSKGSAAWVNGDVVIGTGNDNKASYEQGYEKGFEDGEAANLDRKCYYLGNITTENDGEFYCNVKEMVPEVDYTKLTIDNFIICPATVESSTGQATTYVSISDSVTYYCSIHARDLKADSLHYDNEAGCLRFCPPRLYASGGFGSDNKNTKYVDAGIIVSIYLYTGDIIKP